MTPNAETRRQWPMQMPGISLGCDYNPEQWPTAVQLQDPELMCGAGVSLVSLGIFAWALLEPTEGQFDLDWLEAIVNRLHDRGISVDLATGTASPPPWRSRRYPEILPQGPDGTRLWPGARQAWCPSSSVFREKSGILVQNLAARSCDHPGIVLWHVSNELGCHVAACYCDVSADAFREWLQEHYRSLDALNAAWGTTFWIQRYSDWKEILPPRSAPAHRNPTQQLDFRRFSSDELLTQYRLERDVLKRLAPGIPVTTNFMAMSGFNNVDYGVWVAPAGCEVVTRRADGADHVFVINHGDDAVRLPLGGTELLTGATLDDLVDVPGGAVRVVRTSSAGSGGPALAGVRSSPAAGAIKG
jgi:beta-galactosidase